MIDIAKARELIKVITELAIHLNDDEVSDIGIVLNGAIDRMLKEAESEGVEQ